METTVNNGMCRCCASEGAFKDVKTTYHWMGEEEVYADMLRDCFDINLHVSEQGEDGGICEVCITQLRNAINFKKQVLHTEDQFKKHILNRTMFRPNIVKLEVQHDDSDDNNASGDDEEFPAEFEIPIKTEESDELKPKKRSGKATMTTRSKKSKADNGETSTKRLGCNTDIKLKPDVSKILKVYKKSTSLQVKDENDDWSVTILKNQGKEAKGTLKIESVVGKREIDKHYQNIRNILLYSNATPIRNYTGIGYSCCFCPKHFPISKDLKIHTQQTHDDSEKSKFTTGTPLNNYVVKLDITELKCEICEVDIEGLEPIIKHLQSVHSKVMHTDINNHILPFKFEGEALNCVLCPRSFERFKLLQEHMNTHYRNYVCEICNAPFVNKRTLRGHMARHKQGDFPCSVCPKVFDTHAKKLHHEKYVHTGKDCRNKCPYCAEKFSTYAKKMEHMVEQHGAQPRVLKCLACEKSFTRRDRLTRHIKRDHLLERKFECEHCDMKFYGKKEIHMHMLKHTGIKKYTCDICKKAYGRKHTLKEHMRIHADDRRFKCEQCGQAFVQKCSWKSHMRSKHDVFINYGIS